MREEQNSYFSKKELEKEMMEESVFHSNVKQEFIRTTADKINLALIDLKDILRAKNGWSTPVGIFFALLLPLITAEKFKDFFGVSAATWKAIVVLLTIISGAWSFWNIKVAVSHSKDNENKIFLDKLTRKEK